MSSGLALRNHPDHAAAKSGDMAAACRLVVNLTNCDRILELGKKHPTAIIVPVHAQEATGINQIPAKFADYFSHLTGLESDAEIIQSSTVFRTGKGGWHRMAFRPTFDGRVQSGREHILVDDFVTGGGSLSELRQHIVRGGGEVVAMSTIGYAKFSTNIALSESTRLNLLQRYDANQLHDWLKKQGIYDGESGALTESEARLVYGARSLDTATARLVAAKQDALASSQPELFPRERREEIVSLAGRAAPLSAGAGPRNFGGRG